MALLACRHIGSPHPLPGPRLAHRYRAVLVLLCWLSQLMATIAPDNCVQALGAVAQVPAPSESEVVFVDPSVPSAGFLTSHTRAGLQTIRLDADVDLFSQIAVALRRFGEIKAIHLVTHGDVGRLRFAGRVYDSGTLSRHQPELVEIGHHLAKSGAILLYGCRVAAGCDGEGFVQELSRRMAASVFASTDDTGSFRRGANWELEYPVRMFPTLSFLSPSGELSYPGLLGTVAINGKSGWVPVMFGVNKDPVGDSQAGAADTDIVGDATHGSLYVAFDDNGTATTADDTLLFRLRIDNPTATNNFAGVAVVGMDANLDGRVDLFMTVDARNNTRAVRLEDPGTGENISPSTTSTAPLPGGWLPNDGVYPFTASNYGVAPVNVGTDPNWTGNTDLGGNGSTDAFVSWRVPIADLAVVLAKPSLADRYGVYGPRGASGIQGFTKDTTVRYVSFTQTQDGPINGDLNGVPRSYDKNATYSSLGTFTAPMSAANPVSAGPTVAVTTPISGGVINDAEDDSVSISGTSTSVPSKPLSLSVTDGTLDHRLHHHCCRWLLDREWVEPLNSGKWHVDGHRDC